MTDENKYESEHNNNHEEGGMGFNATKRGVQAWFPKELVSALGPSIARWTVPIISIAIGILLVCYGIARIVTAWNGAAPQ